MYSQLIHEAHKATIQERIDKASRLQSAPRPERTAVPRTQGRFAAIIALLGREASPVA
jgi:hypothetical protein